MSTTACIPALDPRPHPVDAPRENRGDQSEDSKSDGENSGEHENAPLNVARRLLAEVKANPSRHAFSLELAKKHGVVEALLLGKFAYLISQNRRKGKGSECAISIRRLAEGYSYLSEPAIARASKKLRDSRVVAGVEKNRNKNNHTLSYSIVDEAVFKRTKEKQLRFNPIIAVHLGIAEAVLFANHDYWIKKNNRGENSWHRKSASQLATLLPFSPATLRRALKRLCDFGLLERKPAKDGTRSFVYRIPFDEPPINPPHCSDSEMDRSAAGTEHSDRHVLRSNDVSQRSVQQIYIPLEDHVDENSGKPPERRTTVEDEPADAPSGDRCCQTLSEQKRIDEVDPPTLWNAHGLTSTQQLIRILFKSGISERIPSVHPDILQQDSVIEKISTRWLEDFKPGTVFELIGETDSARIVKWAEESVSRIIETTDITSSDRTPSKIRDTVVGMILHTVVRYFDSRLTRWCLCPTIRFEEFINKMSQYRAENLESLRNRGLGMIEGQYDYLSGASVDYIDSCNPDRSPDEKVHLVRSMAVEQNATGVWPPVPEGEAHNISYSFYQCDRKSLDLLKRFFTCNPHWSAGDIVALMQTALEEPEISVDYIKHFHLTKANNLGFLLKYLDKILIQNDERCNGFSDLPYEFDDDYLKQ